MQLAVFALRFRLVAYCLLSESEFTELKNLQNKKITAGIRTWQNLFPLIEFTV